MVKNMENPNRKTRKVLSILSGNIIQIAGIGLGWIFLSLSTLPNAVLIRVIEMILGYLLIYFSSHSIAHYLAGRMGGIVFSHYSVGGSSHASTYPPGMRQLFERLPFFAAHTDPQSLRTAHPPAKGLMFGAGIMSTILVSTLGAVYVFRANVPGGSILLVFNIIWMISSLIAEMRLGGDLAKALKAFRN